MMSSGLSGQVNAEGIGGGGQRGHPNRLLAQEAALPRAFTL